MIKVIGDVHGKTGDYKRLVRSMEPGQRSVLFAVEYTKYFPVEFDKFIANPDKYFARGTPNETV